MTKLIIIKRYRQVNWKEEYKGALPDWTKSLKPSLFVKRFVEELEIADLTEGKILEVGSANGRDAIYLSKETKFEVVGIDMVPRAVELAKANNIKLKGSATFVQANAEKLPFEDEEFIGVYSLSVLHSTKLDKSIKEIARVLEPSGLFLFYLYLDTQDKAGNVDVNVYLDALIGLLREDFTIEDLYTEQDDKPDDNGEVHRIAVAVCIRIMRENT